MIFFGKLAFFKTDIFMNFICNDTLLFDVCSFKQTM